jgi:hypothetical protein
MKTERSVKEQRNRRIIISISSNNRKKRIRSMDIALYAMKSPATKEKYLMRLGKFLDFLSIQEDGTLKAKQQSLQR